MILSDTFQEAKVIQHSYNLNCPMTEIQTLGSVSGKYEIEIEKESVILESIKKAEDHDAIVLRFYESFGGHVTTTLKLPKKITAAK